MIEDRIYKALSAARWLLLAFYVGLALALVGYGVVFLRKLASFLVSLGSIDEIDALLKILGLIDSALVAGLVLMVLLSGYRNFISSRKPEGDATSVGNISFGALKLKFMATIAAIGAINLLETILDEANFNIWQTVVLAGVQLVFLLSVLAFAYVEKHGERH